MQRASEALARMDYLSVEDQCLEALRQAREDGAWPYYARILLPLQEARRQRRMIAADGVVRLGTARLEGGPMHWLSTLDVGCIVVTHPHTAADAHALEVEARRRRRYIEVLLADNAPGAEAWTICAFHELPGAERVRCTLPAPPPAWQDSWLAPRQQPAEGAADADDADRTPDDPPTGLSPADWFIDATEALGDAALRQVTAPAGDPERIAQLERMLQLVTDHEILHQRLGDAARAMRGERTPR